MVVEGILEGARKGIILHGIGTPLGSRCAGEMVAFGTPVLGILEPGRGGTQYKGVPVFDGAREAVVKTGAKVLVTSAVGHALGDVLLEADQAGIGIVLSLGDDQGSLLALKAIRRLSEGDTTVIGPSSHGIIVPGSLKVGVLPHRGIGPGPWALLSRSALLAYQFLRLNPLGIALWVDIGESAKGKGNLRVVREIFECYERVLYIAAGDLMDIEIFRSLKARATPGQKFAWVPRALISPDPSEELTSLLEELGFTMVRPGMGLP